MRILVVAATDAELAGLAADPRAHRGVDFLATGVGMVNTAARVSRVLAIDKFDFALNVGLCGSFNAAYPPGAVVHVISDRVSEMGAEDGDSFLALDELNLPGDQSFSAGPQPVSAALSALPRVSGITVNTVHGNDVSIARAIDSFHADVESMEGGAFMCACLVGRTPFAQVRAVSNLVERRNRKAWKTSDALESLTKVCGAILDDLL